MSKSYQKEYRENMSDEKDKDIKIIKKNIGIICQMNKNKKKEKLIGNIKKKYRDNMTDEQKKNI